MLSTVLKDVSTIEEAITLDLVRDEKGPFDYKVKVEDVQELSALFEDLEDGVMGGFNDEDDDQPVAIAFCNNGYRGGLDTVLNLVDQAPDVLKGLTSTYNLGLYLVPIVL